MSDHDSPTAKRVRAKLADPQVLRRLRAIAQTITGSWADADDLLGDAILRVLKTDSVWLKWTFLTYMTYVMRHIWAAQLRAARAVREFADEDVTRGKRALSREPPADDELDRRRFLALLRMLGERLLAEIEHKSAWIRPCFELSARGIEEPAEQASILKCDVAEVYEAHRLMKYHGRRIFAEWEGAEEARMKERQQEFRPSKRKVGS